MHFLINCIEHNSKFLFDFESSGVRFVAELPKLDGVGVEGVAIGGGKGGGIFW